MLPTVPDVPFEFEALLESWRTSSPDVEAIVALRAFLDAKAHSIVEHLADELLIDALAAWQREGELLFAQRRWASAHVHYSQLGVLLENHAPLISAWCFGAAAECRIEDGDLVSGIADLADVLATLDKLQFAPGIEAMEHVIGDAVGRLESSGDFGSN